MAEYTLSDVAHFSGEWFLPESGDQNKISGMLAWEGHRASLKLNDSFNPVRGALYGNEVHSYDAVHGISTASELVTLLKPMRTGSNLSFGAAGVRQTECLLSNWVVIGAHVNEGALYQKLSFRIPGMQLWLGRSGISRCISTDSSPMRVVYEIEHLAEEEVELPVIASKIAFGLGHRYSGDMFSEIKAEISSYLTIRPDQPQTLEWFFDERGKVLSLLSMLAGSPMAHDHAAGVLAGSKEKVEVLTSLRESTCCAFKTHHNFFMLRNNMGVDLPNVIQKWFELYGLIETPSQLALSILNSRNLWSHVEFLSLMQALEGFHRATLSGLYTSADEYAKVQNELCKAIPKSVGADHRESLKSRIKYGNEISLRKRLDGLVSKLPEGVRQMILGGDGKLPRSWVVTRNYYTHWDEASKNDILDGIGMHRACVRMRLLLRVLYLDFVGVPASAILAALTNTSGESQYLIQLNNADYRARNPGATVGAIMHVGGSESDPEAPASATC